jgi:hypothetical protein
MGRIEPSTAVKWYSAELPSYSKCCEHVKSVDRERVDSKVRCLMIGNIRFMPPTSPPVYLRADELIGTSKNRRERMKRLIYYTLIHMKDRNSITMVQITLNPNFNTSYPILVARPYPYYPYSEEVAYSANQVSRSHLPDHDHIAADMVNSQDTDLHTDYTRCLEEDSTPALAEGTAADHIQPADMADTLDVVVEVVVELVISIRPIHQPVRLD